MKRKFLVMLATVFALALTAQATFAWTGVTGQAFDDQGQGWTHGGDVYILNNATGDIEGTGTLAGDGSFSITYGTDGLTCGCVNLDATAPTAGSSMSVFIIYNNGGLGTPGTGQANYSEAPIPTAFNLQVNTGTGPTAINLQSVSTNAGVAMPLAVGVALLLLAGASIVILRRRSA